MANDNWAHRVKIPQTLGVLIGDRVEVIGREHNHRSRRKMIREYDSAWTVLLLIINAKIAHNVVHWWNKNR